MQTSYVAPGKLSSCAKSIITRKTLLSKLWLKEILTENKNNVGNERGRLQEGVECRGQTTTFSLATLGCPCQVSLVFDFLGVVDQTVTQTEIGHSASLPWLL